MKKNQTKRKHKNKTRDIESVLNHFVSLITPSLVIAKRCFKAMFTLYRIALAPPRKSYPIGPLFAHKRFVTEGICIAPILKVERQISDRF